jgi:hypothetical protein
VSQMLEAGRVILDCYVSRANEIDLLLNIPGVFTHPERLNMRGAIVPFAVAAADIVHGFGTDVVFFTSTDAAELSAHQHACLAGVIYSDEYMDRPFTGRWIKVIAAGPTDRIWMATGAVETNVCHIYKADGNVHSGMSHTTGEQICERKLMGIATIDAVPATLNLEGSAGTNTSWAAYPSAPALNTGSVSSPNPLGVGGIATAGQYLVAKCPQGLGYTSVELPAFLGPNYCRAGIVCVQGVTGR